MAKFHKATQAIMQVFGTAAWLAEDIKTIPSNYIGGNLGSEYIRVNVMTSGAGININSLSGQLIIDVFVPSGEGMLRATDIADTLDKYLVGKMFISGSDSVQLGNSTFSSTGLDAANRALYRYRYTMSFNFYGVTN